MDSKTIAHINRGLLWGQLLTGLEAARGQIELARRGSTLLSDDDCKRLIEARDTISAIEQRAWVALKAMAAR